MKETFNTLCPLSTYLAFTRLPTCRSSNRCQHKLVNAQLAHFGRANKSHRSCNEPTNNTSAHNGRVFASINMRYEICVSDCGYLKSSWVQSLTGLSQCVSFAIHYHCLPNEQMLSYLPQFLSYLKRFKLDGEKLREYHRELSLSQSHWLSFKNELSLKSLRSEDDETAVTMTTTQMEPER